MPIRTLIQKEGRVPQAYDLGIKNAQGDLLLFIDDDAIAEPLWVDKYITFFNKFKNIGGASGKIYMAKIDTDGKITDLKEFKGGLVTKKFLEKTVEEFKWIL